MTVFHLKAAVLTVCCLHIVNEEILALADEGPESEVNTSNAAANNLPTNVAKSTTAEKVNANASVLDSNKVGVLTATREDVLAPVANISSKLNGSKLLDNSGNLHQPENLLPLVTVKQFVKQPNTTIVAGLRANKTLKVMTFASASTVEVEETKKALRKKASNKTIASSNSAPSGPIPKSDTTSSELHSDNNSAVSGPSGQLLALSPAEPTRNSSELPSGSKTGTSSNSLPSGSLPALNTLGPDGGPSEENTNAAEPKVSAALNTTMSSTTWRTTTAARSPVLPAEPKQIITSRLTTTVQRAQSPDWLTSDQYYEDGSRLQCYIQGYYNNYKSENIGRSKPVRTDASQKNQQQKSRAGEELPSTNTFIIYFLVLVATVATLYVIYHNRQRIKGLIIEGRQKMNSRRTKGGTYKKLATNAEDILPEPSLSKSVKSYVY